MANPPAKRPPRKAGTRSRAQAKSGGTAFVQSVAAVLATVGQEAEKADRDSAASAASAVQPSGGDAGGIGGGRPGGTTPAGGRSSRGTMAAKAAAGAAPIAVAALALLTAAPAPMSLPAQPPLRAMALPADAAEPPPALPSAAPPACLANYQLALPLQRGEGVASRETLICRRGYVLAFNNDMRNPDWVMEHLTPAELSGHAQRSNRFLHDPALPPGADARSADYSAGHFDRGHQAPAGDSSFDQHVQDESFFFTNMSPQVGLGFNRGAWRMLEEHVRDSVLCGGHQDIYVMTGPIYGPNPAVTGADRVAVPQGYFKIVYDTLTGYAVGFVMPNQATSVHFNAQDYVVPIADIETATGLDFFSAFDRRRQATLESGRANAWGHIGACASGA